VSDPQPSGEQVNEHSVVPDTPVSLGITEQEASEAKRIIAGLPVTAVAQRSDFAKMLIYGVPGVGKTMLAGSSDEVERMRPVLFIDIEGGTKTIRDKYPDVEVLRVKDEFDAKGRLMKTSWERLQDVYEDIRKGVLPYKTYVIDSLTEGQKMSMYSVMTRTVKGDPARDLDIPAQRDWGKSGEMVRRMVRAFRDLDANVIFTALEASDKDQQTGAVTITPSLPGKLKYEISAFLDEVLYMYTKVEKDGIIRRVLTQPTGKFIAKDRSGRLPQTMDDPNMAEIADLVLDPKEN